MEVFPVLSNAAVQRIVPHFEIRLIQNYFLAAARDVLANLERNKIRSPQDFNWLSQMRYYFDTKDMYVHMITTEIAYGYEYLGNSSRLVITPLTDRCYR